MKSQLKGHLALTCAAREDGSSYLSRQSFRAPFHISKPYWDGQTLITQVVNPTAGLFAGDSLRSDIRVEAGARLHITTPSASRVHTMDEGRATVEQHFHVANGAWLEFTPAQLIPQRGGRYRQSTRVEVESGGEAFFAEILAPGRVARGECLEYQEIDWECDLVYARRLVARERFILRPNNLSLESLRTPISNSYYASSYLISERLGDADQRWNAIRALNSSHIRVGLTNLANSVWSVRLLTADSILLSKAIDTIRRINLGDAAAANSRRV